MLLSKQPQGMSLWKCITKYLTFCFFTFQHLRFMPTTVYIYPINVSISDSLLISFFFVVFFFFHIFQQTCISKSGIFFFFLFFFFVFSFNATFRLFSKWYTYNKIIFIAAYNRTRSSIFYSHLSLESPIPTTRVPSGDSDPFPHPPPSTPEKPPMNLKQFNANHTSTYSPYSICPKIWNGHFLFIYFYLLIFYFISFCLVLCLKIAWWEAKSASSLILVYRISLANTQRRNNVVTTSLQRRDVAATLWRRCNHIVYYAG